MIAALGVGVTQVSAERPPIVYAGWGPLSLNGGIRPKVLPERTLAPIGLGFSGRLSTTGAPPPALTQMTIDLDKNGAIDATGLPSCARSRLQKLGTDGARRICRKSIVGLGKAHLEVPVAQRVTIALTLYNGGVRDGVTTIFVHGVLPAPTPTPAIATVKIKKISQGRFGLQAIATMPLIPAESSSLRDFSFTIERRFMRNGVERSFAMARCIDSHLDGRLSSFSLSTGEQIQGEQSFVRACVPR